MITLDISRGGGDWRSLAKAHDEVETLVTNAAEAALATVGRSTEDLTADLLLADDATLRELNLQWRRIDRPTNVLSFPGGTPGQAGLPRHLGDLAVAYETVVREAADEGKRPADHLAHLIVHGILHLLGHDHADAAEADAMEAIEVAALARLGISDPYRDSVPDMTPDAARPPVSA